MPGHNTILSQIGEYLAVQFPKQAEKSLGQLRKNDFFYPEDLPTRRKYEENKTANLTYLNWSDTVKYRFFKLYICLFNLRVIESNDQQERKNYDQGKLIAIRYDQVKLANTLINSIWLLSNYKSLNQEKLDILDNVLLKYSNFPQLITEIIIENPEDFTNSDISNSKNLKKFINNHVLSPFKFTRRIPITNTTISRELHYNITHTIPEEPPPPRPPINRNWTRPSYPSWGRRNWTSEAPPQPSWNPPTYPTWGRNR